MNTENSLDQQPAVLWPQPVENEQIHGHLPTLQYSASMTQTFQPQAASHQQIPMQYGSHTAPRARQPQPQRRDGVFVLSFAILVCAIGFSLAIAQMRGVEKQPAPVPAPAAVAPAPAATIAPAETTTATATATAPATATETAPEIATSVDAPASEFATAAEAAASPDVTDANG